ncbi:nucleoside triphosphate pyrophosphohydrolase [Candidatus Protofrankia californiensis]|uniref:nucleoside triphosphate pyrophosphohydrolase n=1 Tax=Candidatus Protofrankia californiensis TaxID=1839754 RepID=UPI0010410973|nr:MazG family protein [Candidatus Protofrankia californiensis]
MTASIAVVVTSPRVAPGLLDVGTWDLLRTAGAVCCGSVDHPQRAALVAAGIPVEVVADAGSDAPAAVEALRKRACADPSRPVVWLAAAGGGTLRIGETARAGEAARAGETLRAGEVARAGEAEPTGDRELLDVLAASAGVDLTVTVVEGSRDLPGARLLDAVAVMDRLRSPGGCPWDAEQTHTSLAAYLLEEAYEAYQAIEDGNHADLREELGDVLMQVLFHARIAAEGNGRADGTGDGGAARDETGRNGAAAREAAWDIDDVAAGLTDKLVRRHPHVFGSVTVDGAAAVETNWDRIKDVEKGRRSVTEGVPLSQPALALAAKLQKRAVKVGVPLDLVLGAGRPSPAEAVAGLAGDLARATDRPPTPAGTPAETMIGDLLFAAVVLARQAGVDPEAALRTSARRFRDTLTTAEDAIRTAGLDARDADADSWRTHWPSADEIPAG